MPSTNWELFVPSDEPVHTQVLRVGFLLAHWLKSLPTAVRTFGRGPLVTTRGTGSVALAAGFTEGESWLAAAAPITARRTKRIEETKKPESLAVFLMVTRNPLVSF